MEMVKEPIMPCHSQVDVRVKEVSSETRGTVGTVSVCGCSKKNKGNSPERLLIGRFASSNTSVGSLFIGI